MNRHEHLMIRAMEECSEVAQRLSKALVFGMDQIQKDPDDKPEENPECLTNRERVMREFYDLRAVLGMCGFDAWNDTTETRRLEFKKVEKVERYLKRSRACGTLTDEA